MERNAEPQIPRPGQRIVQRWLQRPGQVCVDSVDCLDCLLKYPPPEIYTNYRSIKMQNHKLWIGSHVRPASHKSMDKWHVSCHFMSITFVTRYHRSPVHHAPVSIPCHLNLFCISFQVLTSNIQHWSTLSCHLMSSRWPCHSPQKSTEAEHG